MAMGYRVVELGPFGSRIYRGHTENLGDLPEGYLPRMIVAKPRSTTVYVEPVSESSGRRTPKPQD